MRYSQPYHSGTYIPHSSYIFYCICFQNLIPNFLPSDLMPASHANSKQTNSLKKFVFVFYLLGKNLCQVTIPDEILWKIQEKGDCF